MANLVSLLKLIFIADSDSSWKVPDSGTHAPMTTEIDDIFLKHTERRIRSTLLLAAMQPFCKNQSPPRPPDISYTRTSFAEVCQRVYLQTTACPWADAKENQSNGEMSEAQKSFKDWCSEELGLTNPNQFCWTSNQLRTKVSHIQTQLWCSFPPKFRLQFSIFLSVNWKYKYYVQTHRDNGDEGQRNMFTHSLKSWENNAECDLYGKNGS